MENNPPPLDADRIALRLMFRAIAEYGRKVRLRRQAADAKTEPVDPKPVQQAPSITAKEEKSHKP
ncbi:MAG: hypothetical protein L6Q45_09500 [Anaerolineales bacterium]|nr:hypothetical protein [Anaerolineales bacterium]